MADNKENLPDANEKVIVPKVEETDCDEGVSGSESVEMTEEKTNSEKTTEGKLSVDLLSPLPSDTSGIEVKSESVSDLPSGAEMGSSSLASVGATGGCSPREGEPSTSDSLQEAEEFDDLPEAERDQSTSAATVEVPVAEPTSPRKSRSSSFTGAIRKMISPRKKERKQDEDSASPQEKSKGSFWRNPLRSSKSMSPPEKPLEAAVEEEPEAIAEEEPTKDAPRSDQGASSSGVSPQKKSGKGFKNKLKKSISNVTGFFTKRVSDESEGLVNPEDVEAPPAEASADDASGTKPVEGPVRERRRVFPYWGERGFSSLDSNSGNFTLTTDVASESSSCETSAASSEARSRSTSSAPSSKIGDEEVAAASNQKSEVTAGRPLDVESRPPSVSRLSLEGVAEVSFTAVEGVPVSADTQVAPECDVSEGEGPQTDEDEVKMDAEEKDKKPDDHESKMD